MLCISYSQMESILDYFCIPRRSIKEANNKLKLEKAKATCLERLGVDYASKSDLIKQKKKNTFNKNYGVDNIFKSKSFIKQLPIIMEEKYGKGSLPNRYGNMQKWWDLKTQEYKKEHMFPAIEAYVKKWTNLTDAEKDELIKKRCTKIVNIPSSKIETRVSDVLANNKITHYRQFWISRKSYDIRLSGTKILIEVQGDFWHANPRIFDSNDILPINDGLMASTIWEKDLKKKQLAEKYGYKIIYLWENDIKCLSDDDLFKFITLELLKIKIKIS